MGSIDPIWQEDSYRRWLKKWCRLHGLVAIGVGDMTLDIPREAFEAGVKSERTRKRTLRRKKKGWQ